MAGYLFHFIHALETYIALLEETRAKMSPYALKDMLLGAAAPDLVDNWKYDAELKKDVRTGDKERTHFNIPHPEYGTSYMIPDMEEVEKRFLKKEPASLGVYCHLQYDLDHINDFLLKYFQPAGTRDEDGEEIYRNVYTGEKIDGTTLWGNWGKNIYGQLYQLYDLFNAEMAKRYTGKFNQMFETNFPETKEGFLEFLKWLFGATVPLTGIPEMDPYRGEKINLYT